jgi:hypothetical protein
VTLLFIPIFSIPADIISHLVMSRAEDDREGLSPSPPNLIDIFEDDDESDDVYEPVPEESEYTTTTNDDGEDEAEFAGMTSPGTQRRPVDSDQMQTRILEG